MAKAVISEIVPNRVSSIKTSNSYKTKISSTSYKAKVLYDLPFRVRFTSIGVPAYSSNDPAPIGIAVIGFNNYIL